MTQKDRPPRGREEDVMELPRLTGYPLDQEIAARLRERQRARDAMLAAVRAQRSQRSSLWGFLQRLTG